MGKQQKRRSQIKKTEFVSRRSQAVPFFNLANQLTLLRILLTILIVIGYFIKDTVPYLKDELKIGN
jgi:hypothetical protein